MYSKQAMSQGIRWAVLGKILGQLISWTSTILVIRLLSPEDYGLIALAGVPIGLIAILCGLGLDEIIVRKKELTERYQRQALGALLLTNTVLYGLICLFSGVYADYLQVAALHWLLPLLGLQLLIGCFSAVPSALLERQLRIRHITSVEASALVTASLCSLLLAYNGFGVWALISATLVNQAVRSIGLTLAAAVRPVPDFQIRPLLSELRFAGFVLANKSVWYLTLTLDDLLIGKLLGQQQLGFYSVGKNFAMLPLQKIASIIHQISFPSIAHSQHDHQSRELILKGLSLICFATFPIFFGVATVAEPLTALLFGDQWGNAASVLAMLSLLMPVKTINNFIGTATAASGRPDVRLTSQLIILAATLAAVGIGYPQGLDAVLGLLVASHYLILPLILFNYCRALPLTLRQIGSICARHLLTSMTLLTACMLLSTMLDGPEWMTLLTSCFIFGVGYLSLALMVSRQDLDRLLRLLPLKALD